MLSRKVKLVSSAMPIRLLTWIIRAGNVYLRIKFMRARSIGPHGRCLFVWRGPKRCHLQEKEVQVVYRADRKRLIDNYMCGSAFGYRPFA